MDKALRMIVYDAILMGDYFKKGSSVRVSDSLLVGAVDCSERFDLDLMNLTYRSNHLLARSMFSKFR